MHICMDELRQLWMIVPCLGAAIFVARHYWHKWFHKGPPKADGCCPDECHDD